MDKKTQKLMSLARKMFKLDHNNPTAEKEWLDMLSKFSGGICGRCGAPLKVKKIKRNFQGVSYILQCGDLYKIMQVDDEIKSERDPRLTFNKSSIQMKPNSPPLISATHSGRRVSGDHDELGVARKFIEIAYPQYEVIKKNSIQSSIVDIIAQTKDLKQSLNLQITKLYPQEFWKELHTKNKTTTQEDVDGLLIKALDKKNSFDPKEKEKTILLIDTWPGFDRSVLGELSASLQNKIIKTGYKEIWCVGSLDRFTFSLTKP